MACDGATPWRAEVPPRRVPDRVAALHRRSRAGRLPCRRRPGRQSGRPRRRQWPGPGQPEERPAALTSIPPPRAGRPAFQMLPRPLLLRLPPGWLPLTRSGSAPERTEFLPGRARGAGRRSTGAGRGDREGRRRKHGSGGGAEAGDADGRAAPAVTAAPAVAARASAARRHDAAFDRHRQGACQPDDERARARVPRASAFRLVGRRAGWSSPSPAAGTRNPTARDAGQRSTCVHPPPCALSPFATRPPAQLESNRNPVPRPVAPPNVEPEVDGMALIGRRMQP